MLCETSGNDVQMDKQSRYFLTSIVQTMGTIRRTEYGIALKSPPLKNPCG